MGANKKSDATYHGGKYTPNTEEVEDSYTMDQVQISLRKSTVVAREEFRRWLETVRAEAKAEALREVASDLENASVSPIWCWDKCGDPKCRDDIRVDTATEIQSWIRDRADKHVQGLS